MVTCPNCRTSNADGARFYSNCGNALDAVRPIEGERRFATVLFADVARSTAIAEQMDPEDWALIMNGAFGLMNAGVSRYGGTVSRLMGDAILALFGAPVAHEDDPERAVRAGLEIQQSAVEYARSVKQRHGVDFSLRVGINTGTAVLAFVGDAIKTEYTAMGDVANVAARLQSAAEPGTVLISADTYNLVRTQFDFRPRGGIEMKGKLAPVESYEVVGVAAVPGNPRGLEALASALVGRDKEIALLGDRFAALSKGMGAVIAVIGEAGLGKSRLIAELRNQRDAQTTDQVQWIETRALSYGQSIPYYPWRTLGRRLVGASEMDSAAVVREKLQAFVKRLGLEPSDVPFYETMLAVDTEESRVALSSLTGEAIVGGVAGAVVNAVKAAIRSPEGTRPFVFVMDDLHWSDSATLELLAQVATLAAFEPLLVICVLRPDRKAPSWQLVDRLSASLGASFDRIELEPLDPAASRQLLGNLLHIEDLPDSIRAQILERSEGNPFYLEEVLRSLIDQGQVVNENGHWRATRDILSAEIPTTLAGVLSGRIDRLPEATKRVAQTAAVLGRVFMSRLLESVCRAAPATERIEHVAPHLATLSYEQLVREQTREPEREYIFKHAMTCEAAYNLLLRSRRKDLHARAGAALETLFAERREEFAPMLAYHFSEADDLGRALTYSMQAAVSARKLFASREELEHRDRILSLLDRMPDVPAGTKIDAIIEWTIIRHWLNKYDGVLDRLAEAVELGRAANDKRRLATALSWTGNIYMVTGFPVTGVPYITESGALSAEMGDENLLLLPLFIATWSMVDRNPHAAVEALTEVMDLARKQRANDVLGHAMAYRALALARLGDFAAARIQVEEALEVAPHAGSPVKEADIHIAAGMAYYDMGEIELGLKHSRIGADKAFSAHGMQCACAGFFGVGRGELERHELAQALTEFGRSLDIAEVSGWEAFTNMIRGSAAVAEFEQGTATAVNKLRVALSNAQAYGDDFTAATIAQRLAAALVKLGELGEVQLLLEPAIEYYRERDMRPFQISALEELATFHELSGRAPEAAAARAEAAALRADIRPSPSNQPTRVLAQA